MGWGEMPATAPAIMQYCLSEAPLQASPQVAVEPLEREAGNKIQNLAKLNAGEIASLCLQRTCYKLSD